MNIFSTKDIATLGPRLKATRERLGMSQTALAAKSKIGRWKINRIENGTVVMNLRDFVALCDALDVVMMVLWPGDKTDLAEMTYTWRGLKKAPPPAPPQKPKTRKKIVSQRKRET